MIIDLKYITVMIPIIILFGTIFHSWLTGKGLWELDISEDLEKLKEGEVKENGKIYK